MFYVQYTVCMAMCKGPTSNYLSSIAIITASFTTTTTDNNNYYYYSAINSKKNDNTYSTGLRQ